MLAEYAVCVDQSRGRRYAEAEHPYRNDFQRDRDRVIHSRAFRRLEAKTQVFTRRYCDHFRNRLTHTLEVAQIARTIALQLGLNADLVEALALVHDVGHPPFGHVGERALDTAMRERGLSFNHNLHALRIVEHFELRYAAFRGLNLTFEVREGIIKHSADYSPDDFPQLAEYLLDRRPPLEAQLIDLADEIAYTTADLDDGYEAHLLDCEDIRSRIEIFACLYREAENTWPSAVDKLKFNEVLRRMVDGFVGDLIRQSQVNIARAGIDTLEDVRICRQRLIGFSPELESQRRQAKAFLYEKLYSSSALDSEKKEGERVIRELFEYWMERPENLPANYQEKAASEPLARVVCDYIAGMTDNYIYQQYERHCLAKPSK